MTTENTITQLKFGNTDVFLEVMGPTQGKLTISDLRGCNYSYYWGSMGDGLHKFLCRINSDYFASKLMGSKRDTVLDAKATFAAVRKFLRQDLELKWYMHQEFQADMRKVLNEYQAICEGGNDERFVMGWEYHFINQLNFYLIDDRDERERWRKDFESMSEVWHFIQSRPSDEYLRLEEFHATLKAELEKVI